MAVLKAAPLALLPLALLFAACRPAINDGSYECGPEELCPEDQRCSGSNNTCVTPGEEEAFTCAADEAPHIDDTPATGRPIVDLACVSLDAEVTGCLAAADADAIDWFQFDAPVGCAALKVVARVKAPIGWQPLALQFSADGGPAMPIGDVCANSGRDPSFTEWCIDQVIDSGHHYAIGVLRAPDGPDCDGKCAYNRYTMTVSLQTP